MIVYKRARARVRARAREGLRIGILNKGKASLCEQELLPSFLMSRRRRRERRRWRESHKNTQEIRIVQKDLAH